MLMATWKVAPALAAGCAAILKPSELASVYVSLTYMNLFSFDFGLSCYMSLFFEFQDLFGAGSSLHRGRSTSWCP